MAAPGTSIIGRGESRLALWPVPSNYYARWQWSLPSRVARQPPEVHSWLITPTERIAVGGIFYAQLSMGCFGRRTGKRRALLGFGFGRGTIWRNISLWHSCRQRHRVIYYRVVRHAHRP